MARDCILYYEDCKDEPIQFMQHAHLDFMPWLEQVSQATLGRSIPALPENWPEPATESVEAFVDKGCWKWQCPTCGGHYFVSKTDDGTLNPGYCFYCTSSGWRKIVQPTDPTVAAIEAELLKMPGHRVQSPLRDWQWDWDMAFLEDRTERALTLQAENPGQQITYLSPHAVRAWAAGEILTAPNMVTYLNNPIRQLQGYMGVIEPQDSIKIGVDDKYLQLVPQAPPAGVTAGASGTNGVIYFSGDSGIRYISNGDWVVANRMNNMHDSVNNTGTMYAVGSVAGQGIANSDLSRKRVDPIPPPSQDNRVLISRQGQIPTWSNESVNALGGGGFLSKQTFDSSGTWTKPDDTKLIRVECWGAGGGGDNASHGGGGGAYTEGWFDAADIAATVSVTVAGATSLRSSGGSSSFGTHLSAEGGSAGQVEVNGENGLGGSAYGIHGVIGYAGGGRIGRYTGISYSREEDSVYGGGQGKGGNSVYGGAGGRGGRSVHGGRGGYGSGASVDGSRPGGGGNYNGGGGAGRVRVWAFSG